MLTFAEARATVDAAQRPRWNPADGVFYVSSLGFETSDVYVVDWGASEAIVDGDPDYLWMDAPLTLVDKRTAEITSAKSLDSFALMDAMTPVTARASAGMPTSVPRRVHGLC